MSSQLPSYITSASPIPQEKRVPWYKSTAPTYAGIFLWFVFWDLIAAGGDPSNPPLGGTLSEGIGLALVGLVIAALISHFLFYLVPGLLGMKTGLPLYIVGTSTFGSRGGFLMPGFLMGILQFGWLGVNAFFSSMLIYNVLATWFSGTPIEPGGAYPVVGHAVLCILFAGLAAFVGLKGIQYVARVATYIPLIPLVILLTLLVMTIGSIGNFSEQGLAAMKAAQMKAALLQESVPPDPLGAFGVLALISTYVVGFFATAGAAGVDFGMNNRDGKDVQLGGLVGIALAGIFAAGVALLVVAGVYASSEMGLQASSLSATSLMKVVVGDGLANVFMLLLALAAFPAACFSSFIAANSFRTTLPNVHPNVSVGVGAVASILLAVTGLAGKVIIVFKVIGASFGPICGAMLVDYLLAGRKWPGPRAGFNLAGWIAWAVGFSVGLVDILGWVAIPASPVVAFLVGAIVYGVLAKLGLEGETLTLPGSGAAAAAAPSEDQPAPGGEEA